MSPRNDETAALAADVLQAEYFRSALADEHGELEYYRAEHVKRLTECMTTGLMRNISSYRRCIRDTEAELRRIDRMLDGLNRRFPDEEVKRRA